MTTASSFRFEQPLVARQAREAAARGDAELVAKAVDAVLEVVGRGHDVVAAVLP